MNSDDTIKLEEVDGVIVGRVYTKGVIKSCVYIVPGAHNMHIFSKEQVQQIDKDYF